MASLSKKKILKNTTNASIELAQVGYTVPALGQIIIEPGAYYLLANEIGLTPSGQLDTLIANGSIVVNDGVRDLTVAQGISLDRAVDYLKWPDTAFNIRFLAEPERTNGFVANNIQEAIEEARSSSASKSRFAVSAGFDGTASTGRWLEFNSNVDSNQSGFVLARSSKLREISVALNTTGTVTFQIRKKDNTVLTSVSLSAERTKTVTGLSVALAANLEIMVYTSAGSGARPIVWLFVEPD